MDLNAASNLDLPVPDTQGLRPRATDVSVWSPHAVAGISQAALPAPAAFTEADLIRLDAGLTLWDIWPIQYDDGTPVVLEGRALWVMLSAPRQRDPDARHNCARLRLLMSQDGVWTDCGNLLPDGFSPGSREWSGSTRYDPATRALTLWFTATGRRGEAAPDFEQRLFHAVGKLEWSDGKPLASHWHNLTQSVGMAEPLYADLAVTQGVAGRIKGFRDPYWFRDPATGLGHLLFTASKSVHHSQSDYDGVIGLALANDSHGLAPFTLLPPLVDADGLVNELERPHVIVRDGLYYVFWSSQHHVFNPAGPMGPTGLYGMVAPTLMGPYTPLNGTGLVLSNPVSEPKQAYAWQVLTTLEVISFVDYWGLKGRDPSLDADIKAAQFGGTIAPIARIDLSGATARLVTDTLVAPV